MELSQRDIAYCKGVGSKRADILRKELKVTTAMDLLRQYPYRYEDRSRLYTIAEIDNEDTAVQIVGRVTDWRTIGIGKSGRLVATFTDGTHTVELVWFGPSMRYVKLETNKIYLLFGKPSRFNHDWNFPHPELTVLPPSAIEHTENGIKVNLPYKGFDPCYNTTEGMKRAGLNSKGMRTITAALMPELKTGVPETLTAEILDRYHLMNLTESLRAIHFPANLQEMQRAKERLKFEELFYIQLHILRQMKQHEKDEGFVMPMVGKRFNYFYHNLLPFELTGAQKQVIREIQNDLKSGKQMNRLLQGDVGSGKTLVALMCALLAVDNGYQVCIMAPTEILANQHYETIKGMLTEDIAHVALLTGSTTAKQRSLLHPALRSGHIDILIGTHALLEDNVEFCNLGLVVVDEQHRFGVKQRAKLWSKNVRAPHVLVMTATPIPRTLAMTVYGDLDVSSIRELPPGRKLVHTQHYSIQRKASVNQFIRQQIELGRQIYVVYPLIKENESLDLKDIENGYREMLETFPEYRISMVHGKMKAKDKDEQMRRFAAGETQILVATTVIEVGVNVPNASVMIIMNAERFGLSQLHQLRGRVGRGADQSYCILLTNLQLSQDTRKRMDIMVATNDGFRIAEADLQLRGPGYLEGTQQSGLPFELKIASLATDGQVLELARTAAREVLDEDPDLSREQNRVFRQQLSVLKQEPINWGNIS